MITIIKKNMANENGSITIEATFVAFFFAAILLYVMQRTVFLAVQLTENKLANQLVSVIFLRDLFFDNNNLSQSDLSMLDPMLKSYFPDGLPDSYRIFFEELSYNYHGYNVVTLSGKDGNCQLNHRLSDYRFTGKTAFGKNNSIYRVTVCSRQPRNLFTDDEYSIVESAVQPGHHH